MSEKELHTHGTDCACGHNHHHHDDGCGCGHDHAHEDIDKKAFLRKLVPGLFFFLLGAAVEHLIPGSESSTLWHYVELAAFALSYIFVGFSILREAVEGVLAKNIFNENLLMAVASLGAFAIGEYSEGCAVVLLYTVGEFLQSLAVQKSRRSIKGMLEQKPDTVRVQGKDGLTEAAPETVQPGQTIVVEPGEKIHLDGTVLEGNAEVDTAALTGESKPRFVHPGSEIISGCVNGDGLLKLRTTKLYGESTVAKILDMVENSSLKKARAENFITKFAHYYTPAVCIGALVLAILPPLVLGGGWLTWISRALTFLVISCPCALVISIPLSFFGGIGGASRCGILIKGGNYLEALANTSIAVFDKTGTLTKGVFAVSQVSPANGCTEKELLEQAALAESFSSHPISKSLREACGELDARRATDAQEIAGHGVRTMVDGHVVLAGNARMMDDSKITYTKNTGTGTVVYVARDGQFLGSVLIADEVKEHSKQAIAALKAQGVRTIMLTGDSEAVASEISGQLGLDEYHAQLLPADKVNRVEELLATKGKNDILTFAGDGINDAPVLMRADVGIAMGAMGSDAAIEAADVVLMDDDPAKISLAMKISRKCMHIVYQNIVFALAVKAIFLLLGAFGIANMWWAVFADVGVMILAVLNAMRMLIVEKN